MILKEKMNDIPYHQPMILITDFPGLNIPVENIHQEMTLILRKDFLTIFNVVLKCFPVIFDFQIVGPKQVYERLSLF